MAAIQFYLQSEKQGEVRLEGNESNVVLVKKSLVKEKV
jgi:hypothetical protein